MAVLYAGAEWIGPPHPENYFQGRIGYGLTDAGRQYAITAIGLHHTATTLQGAIDTFRTAPASGRQHSAHFIVDLDGSRYQILDTDDTAFALGDEAANCYTVNIEVVQTWDFGANVKTSDFTDAQYAAATDICRIVAADNGFRPDADHIHGHNYWTPTTCPADLDAARVIQGDDMTPQQELDFNALIWRVETLISNLDTVPGGPSKGEVNNLKVALATIPAANNAAVLAAIADLKAHPDPTAAAIATRIENALKQA